MSCCTCCFHGSFTSRLLLSFVRKCTHAEMLLVALTCIAMPPTVLYYRTIQAQLRHLS